MRSLLRFWPSQPRGGEGPELARKRPTVAPAEGPLTEAVLKHACVVPSGRR